MNEKPRESGPAWVDPDDAPEWTEAMFERAQISDGERVLRPASGTVIRKRGRPRSDRPKKQITLRLSEAVIEHFRATGPGWQTRMEEVLQRSIQG